MAIPATTDKIRQNHNHITENIEDRSHTQTQHSDDVNWQHLVNRMAGAEENNPSARTLVYSKGITEETERIIIETAFEKHQDALACASRLAFDNQLSYMSNKRHNEDNKPLTIDIEMDTWDETNDEPYNIKGEGIIRDPETGHIRPMASSMFTTVVHANSRYETQKAIEDNPRLRLPQFARVTTFCDLESQFEANKKNPVIAAENAAITPNINLMELVNNIPSRFITDAHRAEMICATDPNFESNIHYQANRNSPDEDIQQQIIAVEINDESQILLRFPERGTNPQIIIAPISQMSGRDPIKINNMRELHATLLSEATPAAIKDVHILFSRLEDTNGITRAYAQHLGVGRYANAARRTLAQEQARDAALQELENAAQELHHNKQRTSQNIHAIR